MKKITKKTYGTKVANGVKSTSNSFNQSRNNCASCSNSSDGIHHV